jgi:hypothetical protein
MLLLKTTARLDTKSARATKKFYNTGDFPSKYEIAKIKRI